MKRRVQYLLSDKIGNVILLNTLLFFLLATQVFFESCNGQNKNGKYDSKYKAIHRQDNDFVTTRDTLSKKENLPKRVGDKIVELLKEFAHNNNACGEEDKSNPLIFKIKYSNTTYLYLIKVHYINIIKYSIVAYNTVSNHITINPPHINGKWMENNEDGFNQESKLLVKPLIYFEDINADGKKEIVIKERVHNGTIYNAVVDHYFVLDELMNLKEILCLESKYMFIFDNCLITRSLHSNAIISKITCGNNKIELIGKTKIGLLGLARIISKKIYLKKYEGVLLTGSEVPEKTFLQKGYEFEY